MKQTIVVWANCQGGSIIHMLNKYYSYKFDIKYFVNYEYIRDSKSIPDDFKNTDIFIYQNYSIQKDDTYDLSNILTNILKPSCIKICIPFLRGDFLFCCNNTDIHDKKNEQTKSKTVPFGKFFFGINYIDDELIEINYNIDDENEKKQIIENIYSKIMNPDLINNETICRYYNNNMEYLEKKIVNSDVPELLEFIKHNFKKIRLFHNPNHPTGILLHFMIKKVFNLLNLKYPDTDTDTNENIMFLENSLNDWTMPILPSVRKHYNFTFEDKCNSWYDKDICDTLSFITKYINDLYFC